MSVPRIDREHGVPYGTRSYREYIIRTTYADGTQVDSSPALVVQPISPNVRGLGRLTISPTGPDGSSYTRLERTVTTMATAWTPVETAPERDPDDDDDIDDGDR